MLAEKINTAAAITTHPIKKSEEVLHGVFEIMVGATKFRVAVITTQHELLALDFIDGKDEVSAVVTMCDNILRRFLIDKQQCRAMTTNEKQYWQETLQSWQSGLASPALRLIGTAFQQRVWHALLSVGYGQTISYFDLAKKINSHHRAVAKNGVGRNPIGYFIPCHRVIAKNGGLGGYGGGVTTKIKLLQAEQS